MGVNDDSQDESQDVPDDCYVLEFHCIRHWLQTLFMDCLMKFTFVHKLQAELAEDYCDRLGGIIVDAIDETAQELTEEQFSAYRELAKQMLLDSFGNTANIILNEIQSNH